MLATRPLLMPRSARRRGTRVPSMIIPPLMIVSKRAIGRPFPLPN